MSFKNSNGQRRGAVEEKTFDTPIGLARVAARRDAAVQLWLPEHGITVWMPFSQIAPDSPVHRGADEDSNMFVTEWIAQEKGL